VSNMPARMAHLGADPWSELLSTRQAITRDMRRRLGL
jgi:hypothetical protein